MKSFFPRTVVPVVLVLAAFVRCIPSPDTSGLPPYDAGTFSNDSSFVSPSEDASFDAPFSEDAGITDAGSADTSATGGFGTVNGVVVDYTQGSGKGVVPGARISVALPSDVVSPVTLPAAVTSDANGLFSIANVPAGLKLQITVTKPTDVGNGIAYSTANLVTTLSAGGTVNIAPVLHEGCFQVVSVLAPQDGGSLPITLQNASCPSGIGRFGNTSYRPGAYAALTFGPASFRDTSTSLWTKQVRVEMIPLAYPLFDPADPPDLSWAVGAPGATTPSGLLGAAEYRVVKSDPGQPDDGEPLTAGSDPVSIAVPFASTPDGGAPIAWEYSASLTSWTKPAAGQAATVGSVQSYTYSSPALDESLSLSYVMVQVPSFGWWAVTNGAPATSCVTGTIQGGSGDVLVRAAGVNYLGTSTGLSGSGGTFCVDVGATGQDGTPAQVQLYAESIASGIASLATQTVVLTTSAGSCGGASGPSGCTVVSTPIALAALTTCVSGVVDYPDAGPSTLDTLLVNLNSFGTDQGLQTTAYLGQTAIGAGGAFCALAPPGGEIQLVEEDNSDCYAPYGNEVDVPMGPSGVACGATGCVDAGALSFGCPLP